MASGAKKVTFVIPPEMESMMDKAKKIFSNRSQSEMIRMLVMAGLNSLSADDGKAGKPKGREK